MNELFTFLYFLAIAVPIIACIIVAAVADSYGRHPIKWLAFSVFFTPIFAIMVLVAVGRVE